MTVITRFAPSPTGYLHIGGARTALFNWLYARHHHGRFLLRIEDTDRERSTLEAAGAIIDALRGLGLDWDGEVVHQFARMDRHAEVARALLGEGKAYHCFCTPEELAEMRAQARAEGGQPRYEGRWRDRDPAHAPPGIAPVIRFRAPQAGETVIEDLVQGAVRVPNAQLDDMVLLRADGTPTYMLSVVVDDHDMGISHVIRGHDHLTNAFRQLQLFRALDWEPPLFAHIPLIHGPDGTRLSKRHGAVSIDAYRRQGVLPEAMRNYLLRLGWSHGDDEVIDTEQAIAWFDLDGVGRSAARFDMARLESLNGVYIRKAAPGRLVELIAPRLEARLGRSLGPAERVRLEAAMDGLKPRARTLAELADGAFLYVAPHPIQLDAEAARLLDDARGLLVALHDRLQALDEWHAETLESCVRQAAEAEGVKLGRIAQPLRAALTGSTVSPGIFEVMSVLGRDEVLARLQDAEQVGAGPARSES